MCSLQQKGSISLNVFIKFLYKFMFFFPLKSTSITNTQKTNKMATTVAKLRLCPEYPPKLLHHRHLPRILFPGRNSWEGQNKTKVENAF